MTKEKRPPVAHGGPTHLPQASEVQFVHNAWGQITKRIEPNGVVNHYKYFPESDPYGKTAPRTIAGDGVPTGYLALESVDVVDGDYPRSGEIEDARPVDTWFTYDDRGNAASRTDGRNNTTNYVFNELGDLLSVSGPEGELSDYAYDTNGRAASAIRAVTDLNFPSYLPAAAPVHSKDTYEFNRWGLITESVIDADGLKLKTTWKYDSNDNVEWLFSPKANLTTPPDEHRIRYGYDEADRLVTETVGEASTRDLLIEYVYDANDNLLGESYGDGLWGRDFVFDAFDRLVVRRDTLLNEWQTHLDAAGNVVRMVLKGNPGLDILEKEILQDQYRYYDERDRLLAVRERAFQLKKNPAGAWQEEILGSSGIRVTWFIYDQADNLVKKGDPRGLQETAKFDGHGLPTETGDSGGVSGIVKYDELDNPTTLTQVDPAGSLTFVRGYDRSGRPTSETRNGTVVQRVFYDSLGRPRIREDGVGNWKGITYDGAGRRADLTVAQYDLNRRVNRDGSVNAARAPYVFRTSHDENGNILSIADASGNAIETYEYDERNLVAKRTLPDDESSDPRIARDDNPGAEGYDYEYNRAGQLIIVTDPGGVIIRHDYSGAYLTRRWVDTSTGNPVSGTTEETFAFDGVGRLIEAKDNNGSTTAWATVTQAYNSLGAIVHSKQEENFTGTAYTAEIRAAHLPANLRTQLHYPNNGPEFRYANTSYGAVRRIDNHTDSERICDYGHWGRLFSHRRNANGVTLGFGYDADKQVGEVRTFETGTDFDSAFADASKLIVGHKYAYDEAGKVVRDLDLVSDRFTRVYFDALDRLVATEAGYDNSDPNSLPDTSTGTDYSPSGNVENRQAVKVGSRSPAGDLRGHLLTKDTSLYNAANQLGKRERFTHPLGDSPTLIANTAYRYDKRGNLKTDGTNSYQYDFKNRVTSIVTASPWFAPTAVATRTHRFFYDALDRRVRKDDIRYAHWLTDIVDERKDDASWWKRYIYGGKPGELIAYQTNIRDSNNPELFFTHETRNGDIEFLTDKDGDVTELYQLGADGEPTVVDEDGDEIDADDRTKNPFLRHGKYYDKETGTYLLGSRVFVPETGRFAQRDPGGATQPPTPSASGYTYAGNNPVEFRESESDGPVYTGRSDPNFSEADTVIFAALKTIGIGIVAIGLSMIPYVGPFLVMAIFTVAVGHSMISRATEARQMGEELGFFSLLAASHGDALGISALIEAASGRRLLSNAGLSRRQRAEQLGTGIGMVAFLLPAAVRTGYSAALRFRPGGPEPVLVELQVVQFRDNLWGHLMIRTRGLRTGRVNYIDRDVFVNLYRYRNGRWDIRSGGKGWRPAGGHPTGKWGRPTLSARWIATEPAVTAAMARAQGITGTPQTSWLRSFGQRFENCSTLPGEIGLGLRAPFFPEPHLTVLFNGLVYGGLGGASGGAGAAYYAVRRPFDAE